MNLWYDNYKDLIISICKQNKFMNKILVLSWILLVIYNILK